MGRLVQAAHPTSPVIANTVDIDDINPFANPCGAFFLPPFLSLVGQSGLVITVDKATAAALIAHNDDDLANPAGDVLHCITVLPGERFLDINKIGGQVANKVHVTSGGAEWHNHALFFNNCLGLGVQSLEEGACAVKIILLMRLDALELPTDQLT